MLMDRLAFPFPVALVSHDVLQILVALYIVGTHDVRGIFDHLLGDTRLAGNLDGKRTAWLSDGQLEQGLHLMSIVKHRTVHHTRMILGEVLQVLIVGGDHAEGLLLPELLQHCLCDGTADGRFRSAAELVY